MQECVHKILKLNIAEGQEKEVGTTLNGSSKSSEKYATGPVQKSSDLPCSANSGRPGMHNAHRLLRYGEDVQ